MTRSGLECSPRLLASSSSSCCFAVQRNELDGDARGGAAGVREGRGAARGIAAGTEDPGAGERVPLGGG